MQSRLRRWLLGVLRAGAVVVAVTIGAVLVVLLNLDRPWLKEHIRALVHDSTGFEVDYEAMRTDLFWELELRGLVVRTPAKLRGIAPELLRIVHLRARLAPAALVSTGPLLQSLDADGAALTVVLDETGATSFDADPGDAPQSDAPRTPISALPDQVLSALAPLARVHVSGLSVSLIRSENDSVLERDTLRGLSLQLENAGTARAPKVTLAIGRPSAPLALTLERQLLQGAAGSAVARVSLTLELTQSDARAALDLQVVSQDLAPALSLDQLAHIEAHAHVERSARRTLAVLERADIGRDVATAKASLLIPDGGSWLVQHASGDVDVARLLQLAPTWFVPVRLARGQLHYRIEDLPLDRIAATTSATVEGDLAGLELALDDRSVSVADAALSLAVSPRDGTLLGKAKLVVGGASAALNGAHPARIDTAVLELTGRRDDDGALSGDAELHFAALTGSQGVARGGVVQARVQKLVGDLAKPLAARGDIALDANLASLEAFSAAGAQGGPLRLRVHAPLTGGAPLALDAELAVERWRSQQTSKRKAMPAPARIAFALKDVVPDLERPERSAGSARLAVEAGALRASLEATKRADALDYRLDGQATQLTDVLPFLPEELSRRAPWSHIGVELRSSGRITRFASARPELRQRAELRLTGPALDGFSARTLALDVQSSGSTARHEAQADLRVEALSIDGVMAGDDRLTLSLRLEGERLLHIEAHNAGLMTTDLDASFTLEQTSRTVFYEVVGHLAQLGGLAPLLSGIPLLGGFDLSKLDMRLNGKGNLVGILSDVEPAGRNRLASEPLRRLAGHGTGELHVSGLRWSERDRTVSIPAATWRGSVQGDGQQRSVKSEIVADQLAIAVGQHRIGLGDLRAETSLASSGDMLEGSVEHTQRISVRSVEQSLAPSYAMGDVTASLAARRSADGSIKISELRFENRAGGTILSLHGGIELGIDQRRLSLRTNVEQDLARLSNRKDQLVGRGKAALELALMSPDLRVFRTLAKLELHAASVHLPRAGVRLDTVDGEVPILSDFVVGPRGVELLRAIQVNPYAAQRFTDQHPLLSHRSYLSIARLTTPLASIAPFAANLKIEQNIVSLSQIEMGVRGGTLTGNGTFAWDGAKSKAEANIRASSVLSSHGEPFDGNAALVVNIADRSVEGRADILRIGRRHLLDLIDLQDPRRLDPGMNGLRRALRFGYPDRVRISFKHGFASAGVSFGGLARFLRVGDVRGIPIGPLMERIVQSFQPEEEQQQ